ncbi:MAG: AsmA family protein [Mariprofundus sp.]
MSRSIRYILIFTVLVVVLLLAAPFFIDVNSYKGQIEQKVEDATGRHLTIGTIKASVFPWVGVELENVHLANAKGFSDHDFISVKKLHVKLALMPLLSKHVEIKHFEIVDPKVSLERHEDGHSNWDDLLSSQSAATDTDSIAQAGGDATTGDNTAGGIALAALQAESLSLSGGEFLWLDGKHKAVALTELEIALNDVQLQRPVGVSLSGKLDGNAFDLNANIGPIGDLAKLNPANLPVQGKLNAGHISLQPFADMITGWPAELGDVARAVVGVSANIEQRPGGLRLGEGALKLDAAHTLAISWKAEMADSDAVKLQQVTLAVDERSLLSIKGGIKNLSDKPVYQLHIDSEPLERVWLSAFVPALKDMYAAHPAAWKSFAFKALLAGDANHIDMSELQLKLDQEVLNLSGAVAFAGPDIRLRIKGKQLHLDPWLPQPKQEQAPVSMSVIPVAMAAETAAEPDLRFLKSWRVTTRMNVGTLYLRGLEMGNFMVAINGRNGRIDMNPLSFKLAGGKVVEKAAINVATYPASWTESVHMTGVQAGPLLQTLAGMDMLSGRMDMDTHMRATGLTEAAVVTLNGRGNVLLSNGKLKGFDIAGAIRQFTRPGAAAGPKETDFARLSGSFNIVNGIATNKDLFMVSPLLRVTGKGTVNLVQKVLDYHVTPRVVGTLKGQGDAGMRKGFSVPLHITGPFDAPKIRPEVNAKTLIDNAPALLQKGKIGGTLGGLLNKQKPAGQGNPAQQPASPARQLLKGFGF